MTVYPNVKINLGLGVLRKRADGYHDIETLFVPCFSLCDELSVELSDKEEIILSGASWSAQDDLSYKAWRMLRQDYSLPPVKITLRKHSPVGAGLGGGSSDAAFTLRVVSELFSLGLSDEALASYAARLGSDCPFFVYNRPMIGEGRGEVLTPWEDADRLNRFEIRIAVPDGVRVSTAEAYKGVTPREKRTIETLPPPLREVLRRPVEEWRGLLVNDFESSVFASHPEIEALKEKFYSEGAVYASMSGSGSAVFGIFGG